MLAALEVQRDDLAGRLDTLPGEVAVVIRRRRSSLAISPGCRSRGASPPPPAGLLRMGSRQEIHVLAPPALERRVARAESREVLL